MSKCQPILEQKIIFYRTECFSWSPFELNLNIRLDGLTKSTVISHQFKCDAVSFVTDPKKERAIVTGTVIGVVVALIVVVIGIVCVVRRTK